MVSRRRRQVVFYGSVVFLFVSIVGLIYFLLIEDFVSSNIQALIALADGWILISARRKLRNKEYDEPTSQARLSFTERYQLELDSLDVKQLKTSLKYHRFLIVSLFIGFVIVIAFTSYAIYNALSGNLKNLPIQNVVGLYVLTGFFAVLVVGFYFLQEMNWKIHSMVRSKLKEKMVVP